MESIGGKSKKDDVRIINIIIILITLLFVIFMLSWVYASIKAISIIRQTDKCMSDLLPYMRGEMSKEEFCGCTKIIAEKAQDPIVRIYYGQNQAEEWRKLYEYCEKNL